MPRINDSRLCSPSYLGAPLVFFLVLIAMEVVTGEDDEQIEIMPNFAHQPNYFVTGSIPRMAFVVFVCASTVRFCFQSAT